MKNYMIGYGGNNILTTMEHMGVCTQYVQIRLVNDHPKLHNWGSYTSFRHPKCCFLAARIVKFVWKQVDGVVAKLGCDNKLTPTCGVKKERFKSQLCKGSMLQRPQPTEPNECGVKWEDQTGDLNQLEIVQPDRLQIHDASTLIMLMAGVIVLGMGPPPEYHQKVSHISITLTDW